jgi:hypothetical protein
LSPIESPFVSSNENETIEKKKKKKKKKRKKTAKEDDEEEKKNSITIQQVYNILFR